MVVDLVGILEDGTPKAEGVPTSSAQLLDIPQGSDVTLNLRVTTPAGVPVNLGNGPGVVKMALRKLPSIGPFWVKTATLTPAVARNACTFSLTPNDTVRFPPGQYVYDVWLTQGGLRNRIVVLSRFQILPAATPPP